MNVTNLKIILVLIMSTLLIIDCFAQVRKHDLILSAASGQSFLGFNNYANHKKPSAPINANIDFQVSPTFSVGLAATHEWFGHGTGIFGSDGLMGSSSSSGIFGTRNHMRSNFAMRLITTLSSTASSDLYLGGRLGVSIWEYGAVMPSIQGFVGVRKNLYKNFGVNAEAAFGSPYFFSAGIYQRISFTKNQTIQNTNY